MKCDRCGREVAPEEAVPRGEGHLCEDCLMTVLSPAKACDPWAVKMAKGSLSSAGDGSASLRGLEKRIFDLICAEGKARKTDLAHVLEVTPEEVDRAFAVLRHMELLRGERDADGTVLVVRFSGG